MSGENEDDAESDTVDATVSTESLLLTACTKMQVFLRIRPTSQNEVEGLDDVYKVEDASTLLVKHFSSNEAARRSRFMKSSDNITKKKFSFSKIFNLDVEQSQFFNEAIKPTVVDFLNNQNSTIISYGTADAGKTYTLFGTVSEPGVIPRTIELIYASLNCTLVPWYKPKRFRSVVNLAESDQTLETDTREKLLSSRLSDIAFYENAYKSLEYLESKSNKEISKDSMYSVWISFVEIYNDVIYDLLEVDGEGKNMQLKLATDKHGTTYIQGMRSICATTGLEAYEILNAGQMRLSTDSDSSYKSSRSHSIFTIKLIKHDKDSLTSEVKISSLSFYDLAGTGRIQKSANSDKQLKELNSINKSLLALGRCLKVIIEGQSRQSSGPFRDSKLTRLVQRSLCGKENIILLINVNPTVDLLAESQSVLKFSFMAMKLISDMSKDEKKILDHHTPISTPKSLYQPDIYSTTSSKLLRNHDIDDVIQKNKALTAELKRLQSSCKKKEHEVRKELTDLYKIRLDEIEEYWKNRMIEMEEEQSSFLKFSHDQVNHYYKDKLIDCTNRKRKRTDRGDCIPNSDLEVLQNSKYSSKIKSLIRSMDLIKRSLKKLAETINGATNIELGIDNVEKDTSIHGFDDDVAFYLSSIQDFINSSLEMRKIQEENSLKKSTSSMGIQCSSIFSEINGLCKDIQNLLDPNAVQLPEINDSLDSIDSFQSQTDCDNSLRNLLPQVKELVISNISEKIKLEMENCGKLDEIRELSEKIIKRDREILEIKMQYQESESARMMLLNQKKEYDEKCKTKELFKNIDFVPVESDNCFTDESSCQILSPERGLNSQYSFHNDSRLSLYTCESEKKDDSPIRSSSEGSRNDSGVASSIECASFKLSFEKSCQTDLSLEENGNFLFQSRLSQLKLDYEHMTAQHQEEALKVAKLSQESEQIREAMVALKKNTYDKEKVIDDYQNRLRLNQMEIDRLNSQKCQLKLKHDEIIQNLQDVIKDYEKKITESQVKLEVRQEGENRTAKCLEDYWNKSVELQSELSLARLELEKKSITCDKDHMIKIDQLEKELSLKILSEQKLEKKLTEYEKDLARLNDLSGKLSNFEILMARIQEERNNLYKTLNEKSNCQWEIEDQLNKLVTLIDGRDVQIHTLRSELGILTKTNSSNHRKAQELSKEVARLMENITYLKDDIRQSDKARKVHEQNSKKEIETLRSRLTVFEENAELLNIIRNNSEDKQDEVRKLKIQLSEKNKELELLKKNRHATIQRYECLTQQLRESLKKNPPNKFKKMFSNKQKIFSEGKDCSTCEVHGAEPQIRDWKVFYDEEPIYLSPRSNLHAVTYSSAESSEVKLNKDGPTRLVANVSDKYLENAERSFCLNSHSPCKDLSVDNYESSVELHLFENDRPSRRSNGHVQFRL